jgi:hypothetical protein
MHATIHIHVRTDSAVTASITDVGPGIPTLTIQDLNGAAEVALMFHDDEALDRVIQLLEKYAHEKPFHLRYRAGCPACERQAKRAANAIAASGKV